MHTVTEELNLLFVVFILHRSEGPIRYCTPQCDERAMVVYVILDNTSFLLLQWRRGLTWMGCITFRSFCLELIRGSLAAFLQMLATVMTKGTNITV
jgi:hypothetical protein